MVTTTAVWEINNKHFSELIGLFLGNLQVPTVVNQISQDFDYCIEIPLVKHHGNY